jgi:predicted GH43/DUF377 family glycosyl hydrolase
MNVHLFFKFLCFAMASTLILPFSILYSDFDQGRRIQAYTDLEEISQDFVLEIKKIEIEGHPHAFNPSIIRWKGRLLICFREILHASTLDFPFFCGSTKSKIGVVYLDEDFNPVGQAQFLSKESSVITHCTEDARLIEIDNRLYIVYADNKFNLPYESAIKVHIAELTENNGYFEVKPSVCITRFEGERLKKREKNWVPFNYKENLVLSYSLNPHKIFRLMTQGECVTLFNTEQPIDWPWGELRGGTQAFLVDDSYLAFFHSCMEMESIHSNNRPSLHYFIGAYQFEDRPPFRINKISPEPIVTRGFYSGEEYEYYWKPVQVIFPCGFVHDEQYIWISYGRQDHELWIAKLCKKRLLESLVPL